jgi:hypothetical protein
MNSLLEGLLLLLMAKLVVKAAFDLGHSDLKYTQNTSMNDKY